MMSDDWLVYLVTDPVLVATGMDEASIVDRACGAGVRIVQYRDKNCSDSDFVRRGRELLAIARRHGATFIVNDRVAAAVEIGADGVHIGQQDMPLSVARRLTGSSAIIGVSVVSVAEAVSACADGADYVAVNGVFPTATKSLDEANLPGLDAVRAISAAVSVPVVAIGGINAGNAASVMAAGASGVAVVTAITMRPDVEQAVGELFESTRRSI
ncbi:MAG TPA: thiamine phosphate synthase [Myxococcota bacterium]|nr:thiamine phosphate synthase [Myxococcota bacterium]HOD07798.1 thiamine phosphate synthase [Myxococcota bacterium]HPB50905.1 thiamine phosphate synthase [Myxococcota bacterium]HQP95120.1 thiamine phosphate synthase [Myxococcota bacterium]